MKFLILLVWITSLSNASQEDPIQPCQDDQSNYNHNWKSLGDWKKIIEKTTCNGDSNYVSTRLSHKLSIIVDTDIGGFADDPTAMAVLHGLANQGKVDILAMVGSTRYEGIAMAMDVINTFFGRPHIPLGVTKDPKAYSDKQGSQNWTEYIRDHFKHRINKNAEVEDSIIVLRRTLAAAPDHSVMILQIGHFTNLANLLNTPPDKISHLFGYQLVSQKVTEVVTMAGMFPTGKEWNIEKDAISARSFAKNWPTPVTFVGFEIGHVSCGTKYQYHEKNLMKHNPLAAASYFGYLRYGNYGGCYDAVAALIATHLTSSLYCSVNGHIEIGQDGSDQWHNPVLNITQRFLKVIPSDNTKMVSLVSKCIDHFLPIMNNTTKAL